ncbi:conserved hypothetical protein [Carnobacterium maltaromaticum]|nr:conserved hypothetical protein [Carnobacterium maltaromaticum]
MIPPPTIAILFFARSIQVPPPLSTLLCSFYLLSQKKETTFSIFVILFIKSNYLQAYLSYEWKFKRLILFKHEG